MAPQDGPKRRRRPGKSPTVREVAKRANVAPITVSRVLNNHPSVSDAVRAAVHNAVRELGYRPNIAARELRGSSTRSIGIVMPDLSYQSYWEGIRAMEAVAELNGYSVFVGDSARNVRKESDILERYISRNVSGVIFSAIDELPPAFYALQESGTPTVLISGQEVEESPTLRSAPVDSRQALVDAVGALRAKGHLQIAVLASHQSYVHQRRIEVVEGVAAEFGGSVQRIFVEPTEIDQGRIIRELESGTPPATAIIVVNYDLIPVVLGALAEARLVIPDDISVVVFGDSAWVRAFRPKLSLVRGVARPRGRYAAEQVIRMIEGRELLPPEKFIREFVDQESIGFPRTLAGSSHRVANSG